MTEPLTTSDQPEVAPVALRSRCVREAHRHTWFVVNEGVTPLATIPLARASDATVGRVEVNGEAAEFTTDADTVYVVTRRELRPGAGTIVVLHFR